MPNYIHISDKIKTHDGFIENMESCLEAAEKHGIAFGQPIENNAGQILTAKKYLPEYTVTESINTDSVMIKSSVVDVFGIPEDMTQSCLEEYCRKINKFGYSGVIAHHALYSITDKNNSTLNSYHTIIPFLPVLDDGYYPKKRILFECMNLPNIHCGTTEVMLYSFEAFCRLFGNKYDIYMLTNKEASEHHNLEEKYTNILYPDTIEGTFHLGYVPTQMLRYEPQLLLNRHCMKIAGQILDIIMLRSYKYQPFPSRLNIDMGVRYCDGFTFISNFSKDDFLAYYKDEEFITDNRVFKVIYVTDGGGSGGVKAEKPTKTNAELLFDEYCLIVGSHLEHKAIAETVEAVKDTPHNYIVIGGNKPGRIAKNIYAYKSGRLDDDYMKTLYARCRAVIFPSLYEGFGLPVLLAINAGKNVIVNDNALNHELQELYSRHSDKFKFFTRFEQIADICHCEESVWQERSDETIQTSRAISLPPPSDTWDTFAIRLEEFFDEILSMPVNIERLNERMWMYEHVKDKSELRRLSNYSLKSLLRFAVKENIKNRHPKLYELVFKLRRG